MLSLWLDMRSNIGEPARQYLGVSDTELRRFWIDRLRQIYQYNWESYHEGKRSSTEAS